MKMVSLSFHVQSVCKLSIYHCFLPTKTFNLAFFRNTCHSVHRAFFLTWNVLSECVCCDIECPSGSLAVDVDR